MADELLSGPRTALDLPPLYTKPVASTLLSLLDSLAVKPSTFNKADARGPETSFFSEQGLARYLTGIVSSPLTWIEDESVREEIWAATSARLSERAGRNARPSLTSSFTLSGLTKDVTIVLHEPSMTGDNLGHKTWAAAYLLSKRAHQLGSVIPCLSSSSSVEDGEPIRVLELGAGTGLSGLAFASIFKSTVHLTDLEEIVPNLASNISANEESIERAGSSASAFTLDWANISTTVSEDSKYELVVAADPLYSPEHPMLLVGTIVCYLRRNDSSRVVIELPLREAYQPEVQALRRIMEEKGFELTHEGEDTGYDDWDDGRREVRCWWGIWRWSGHQPKE